MKQYISITELRKLMHKALELRKIDENYRNFIIDDLIEAELGEKYCHGLGKFLLIDEALKQREGKAELLYEIGNYAKYNGNKELGHIAALTCVNKAVEIADKNKNSIVCLTNASRYGRLKPYAKKIAENGYIGIVFNNAGPAATTAYNGITPIFGTNPICFAFPSNNDEPYLFDFATSKNVWGEIRQSILEKRDLPMETFYNTSGKFITNPYEAEAVIPFGDNKGYALCYALEILAGAFTGSKMGSHVKDEYDLGFVFIALSPEMFTDLESFKENLSTLELEVKNSQTYNEVEKVYIPGDVSREKVIRNTKNGEILVDKEIIARIREMSVSLFGGIKSNSKIN